MNINVVYQELSSLAVQKAKIDERITDLRAILMSSIPANSSFDGIAHKINPRRNVKWAEACKRIIDILVAESKRPKAWSMVEQMTTTTDVHTFMPSSETLSLSNEEKEVG